MSLDAREHDEKQPASSVQTLQEALRLGLAVVTELWSYSIKDWISSVHAADIDGDGDIEVVFGSRNFRFYVLTKLGDLKWEKQLSNEWVGVVAGIDDAEALDATRVLVGSRDNTIYAYDSAQQLLWKYSSIPVARQIVVCDINQDGKAEVVLGSEDRSIHVLSCETGELLWKYPTNAWVRAVYAGDIDGDGATEILGGSGDNYLYVLDSTGQLKWRYTAAAKVYALFAGDLDHDGRQEILVSTDAKDLYALTLDQQKLWSVKLNHRILSLFVTDLNNDGRLEILAGSEDKHLYIFNDQGELLWKYYLGARIFSIHVVDVDRDGLLEVFVGSDDNSVHVLRIEVYGGELDKILQSYTLLGQPPTSELNLSPTESALLHVLTDGEDHTKHSYTLHQLTAAYHTHDDQYILAVLLELEQQRVQPLWSREVGYIRTAALADILDDAKLEIVVGTSQGQVRALNADGDLLWSHAFTERVRAIQIGDVDSDGDLEVVAASIDGRVYVLNKMGDVIKWSYKLEDWITSISIAPSASNGHVELIMGSEEKRIYAYDDHFTPVIDPILAPQGIYAILAQDIDQDGIPEIIAGAVDDNVYAYRRDGTLLWTYKTRDRVRALAVEDIDGDQLCEIIVASEDRSAHVLDHHGHLKWRYYAPHRVLDVSIADVDQDGQVEILLGCGDGFMYVLSAQGDLLWRYGVNDRIRVVRVADVDRDGTQEIVLASEDRLYLLQLLDITQLQQQIISCWENLQRQRPLKDLLTDLFLHTSPVLRAFAIKMLKSQLNLFTVLSPALQRLVNDPSPLVRCAFAQVIPAFYQVYPDHARRFFDALSGDREREVRLAFVDSLPAIITINREVGFAYFDRIMRSVDMWVRRALVRKLYDLAPHFPQQVFRLLVLTAQDERTWVRQESARSLAHYFDLHTDNLIEGARSLIAKGIDLSVYHLIAQRATKPMIQNVFRVMVDLFSELDESNLQTRLHDAVLAFEDTRSIKYGPEIWQLYNELYRLSRMHNIDEIARYKYTINDAHTTTWARFEDTLQVLRKLTSVSNALSTYLRREGLGDRLASLLEANKAIDGIYAEVKGKVSDVAPEGTQQLSDIMIFRLVLKHWRSIVSSELSRLIGKAELRLELQTKSVAFEEVVSVWLTIHNDGNSPADTVTIRLQPSSDFTIVGNDTLVLEMVPSRNSVQVEFTIRPLIHEPHLTFALTYNDAGAKGELRLFGDRLTLHTVQQIFKPIPNPYSVGMPIRDRDMFYGRQEDLSTLKSDLTNPTVNVTVVLYGQRRSGKTSLLNQLVNTDVLAPHIPIFIDMQNESFGITISKFLRNISYYIQKALRKRGILVQQPAKQEFEDDPIFVFNCFLDDVEPLLNGQKLICIIDEFEILEQKVTEHAIPPEIFEYLRSLMQHRQHICFLFSGTHTIKQLTAGYWSVFFNIARHYKLSKLGEEAATRLIVRPVAGSLEYDPFAIQKIRQLTADQPYLIQLICRALVDHCNSVQKNYVTINDVNTVLDTVMETGEVHFQWIWEQTDQQERIVLSILAEQGGDDRRLLSLADIEEIYVSHGLSYDHKKVLHALLGLCEKDIVESSSSNTRFRVLLGLAQRWLSSTKTLRRVMLEENLLTQ